MKEDDMKEIAHLIHLAITDFENQADIVRDRVAALCNKYPLYQA